MSEKVWEDIYGQLKKRWWGVPLIFIGLLFIVLFSVWNSLPDTTKERLINPEKESIANKAEEIKKTDIDNQYNIPDLGKATRVIKITSGDLLTVEQAIITDVSPDGFQGYFQLDISKSEHVYSSGNVLIDSKVEPNLFVTARVAPGPGMSTLEIRGLDVWFLLDVHRNKYMIYNSEENQTYWKGLPTEKDQYWNTVGIHQVGRDVKVFLNSSYIDSFKLWNSPVKGKVGLYFKTKPTGGRTEFQRLAVYEFSDK